MIERVYQVRGALDALAARRAAERRAVLAPALVTAGRAAADSGDIAAMIDASSTPPTTAPSTPRAATRWSSRAARLHFGSTCGARHGRGAAELRTLRRAVWDEHEAIAQAIADGRGEAAERLIRDHAERAGDYITRQPALLAHPANEERHASLRVNRSSSSTATAISSSPRCSTPTRCAR